MGGRIVWVLLLAIGLAVARFGYSNEAKSAPTPSPQPPRNFVLITIDTLRADAVGAYGGEWKTPHLDAFAERATVFEQAFSTAPFTGPSHASILTSRHPSKHGIIFNGHRVRGKASAESTFVSEHLKKQGFVTAAVISPSPTRKKFGFGRGFDSFHESCEPAHDDTAADGACIAAQARQWLQERPRGRRFFLWVHFFEPHFPYAGPAEMYEQQGLKPEDWIVTRMSKLQKMPDARVRKAYLADVYEGDHYFGALMQALSDLGLTRDTLVAVTSDHGEYLGEHDRYGHDGLYDEVLHVPLMIASPGRPSGRRSELVSTIDLVPTALELLAVPPMPSAQGRSLLNPAKDEPVPSVFAEWRHYRVVTRRRRAEPGDYQLGVRTPSSKLIVDWLFPEEGSMLFDLERDPNEQRNRLDTDEKQAKFMGAILERHKERELEEQHLEQSDIQIDSQTMKMLEALGYVQ